MDQKRSSSSAGTDVSVVCIVCCALDFFLYFYQAFCLVYGDTGHNIVVYTISQCAKTAGCQYKY